MKRNVGESCSSQPTPTSGAKRAAPIQAQPRGGEATLRGDQPIARQAAELGPPRVRATAQLPASTVDIQSMPKPKPQRTTASQLHGLLLALYLTKVYYNEV